MSVSLVEVMVAASQRLAPLSGECAGHAVLAAADQLLMSPRLVGAADVLIEESGSVRLGHGQAADARGCDEGLRGLLDGLLGVAHSGGAGLLRVGRRPATGDLAQLVKELEVALIPANRAAARRSLARLYRETCRARESGSLSALPAPVLPVAAPAPARELLQVTEVRWATAARPQAPSAPEPSAECELDPAVEIEVDLTPTPPNLRLTQPLPRVAPRRQLHETVPLPPVSSKPLVTDHETPLEPVLSRRHAALPRPRSEFPDVHQTPYLGTLVAPGPMPVYDERARQAWQVPAPAPGPATQPTEWETDESTTDPAPVVAWSPSDATEEDELGDPTPLPPCPALAVEPRVLASPPKERRVFRPSDVSELVEHFHIAEAEPEPHLVRGLKQLAGITATPPPVLARADGGSESHAVSSPSEPEPGSPLRPPPTVRVAGS